MLRRFEEGFVHSRYKSQKNRPHKGVTESHYSTQLSFDSTVIFVLFQMLISVLFNRAVSNRRRTVHSRYKSQKNRPHRGVTESHSRFSEKLVIWLSIVAFLSRGAWMSYEHFTLCPLLFSPFLNPGIRKQ